MTMSPRAAGDVDPSIHQTIGSLNAKADQAQRDVQDLRSGQRAIETAIGALPEQVEEIVARILGPVEKRLGDVEVKLNDVQSTVAKWKAILAVISTLFAIAGGLVSHFVPLKKWFNVE